MIADHVLVEQLVVEKRERNPRGEINNVRVQKRRDGLEIVFDALGNGRSMAALAMDEFRA